MEHYDDFDVLMSDDPNAASAFKAGQEMPIAEAVQTPLIVRVDRELTDADLHQAFVDAITDETKIVPDPAKPGFLKTLAELAIERNTYRPPEMPKLSAVPELIIGEALTRDELKPWHGGTL